MNDTILYVGTGHDFSPLSDFSDSNFVCIDSLPRNQHGLSYYDRGLYQPAFQRKITETLEKLGYEVTEVSNNLSDKFSEINRYDITSHFVRYRHPLSNQSVIYYFSTSVPSDIDNDVIIQDLARCNAVLVKGHHPSDYLTKFLPSPFKFIGCEHTYFSDRIEDEEYDHRNNMMRWIMSHPSRVSSYTFLRENGLKKTFSTYLEFYNEYKNNKSKSKED
jgi:hypothetical protein